MPVCIILLQNRRTVIYGKEAENAESRYKSA